MKHLKYQLTPLIFMLFAGCNQETPVPESATPDQAASDTPGTEVIAVVPEPTAEPTLVPEADTSSQRVNPGSLHTNATCIDIIKESEDVRYEAYVGPNGHWLIGYGHKQGVSEGMKISHAEAEAYLKDDLQEIETQVARMTKVDVSRNEFSAMVCLAYNIGWGNFRKSTVVKRVNEQRWVEAADAFLMWRMVSGKVSHHLEQRREKERALFLMP